MRSKTGCRGNPTSSGVNGLGGGSIRIQRATPHNHALRIIRQRAKHVKNKPTLRGRRVEGFGQTAKVDTFQPQFLDGFDQLLHRAPQAVELPHNQRVAAARECQRLAQGWSIRHRTRQLLGENPPASRFGESLHAPRAGTRAGVALNVRAGEYRLLPTV